jgi:hypothetical protein
MGMHTRGLSLSLSRPKKGMEKKEKAHARTQARTHTRAHYSAPARLTSTEAERTMETER